MKAIVIKIINRNPIIKMVLVDSQEGPKAHEKPEQEWKNHTKAKGSIVIGKFEEIFYFSYEQWTLDDYERQWSEGLKRLEDHDQSCLVINVCEMNGALCIERWILYKIDNSIHVQQRILFDDNYKKIDGNNYFTPDSCYDFIPLRQTHEDDGEKIPELIVEMD
jgi:hypothetical protein